MIWGSVAENIKRELQRRVENIEQSIAWCEPGTRTTIFTGGFTRLN
jgi:hypothetical protein